MYTFRYNPVFEQWVLLGEPIPQSLLIQDAHLLTSASKTTHFVAATYPRQPFVLDQSKTKKHPAELLHAPQPPLGEYELLLYSGNEGFFSWKAKEWEQWLVLVAERFRQFHLNPHLHFAIVKLSTKALLSAGELYQRVGDCIAASHNLFGMSQPLAASLVHKILTKESLFVIRNDEYGALYVPTAPQHNRELWYLPQTEEGFDILPAPARTAVAKVLAKTMSTLHMEFPEAHWQFIVHTPMATGETAGQWWIQIYQDLPIDAPLPIQALPERLALLLRNVGF